MGVTYKANFNANSLRKKTGFGDHRKFKATVEKALAPTVTKMIKRIRRGQGIDGPLKRLSALYADYKQAVGRRPIPDRTLTGALLQAIHEKYQNRGCSVEGTVFFTDSTHPLAPKRAGGGRYSGNNKRTTIHAVARAMQDKQHFFGFRKHERDSFVSLLRKYLRVK